MKEPNGTHTVYRLGVYCQPFTYSFRILDCLCLCLCLPNFDEVQTLKQIIVICVSCLSGEDQISGSVALSDLSTVLGGKSIFHLIV